MSIKIRNRTGKGLGQTLWVLVLIGLGIGLFLGLKSFRQEPEKIIRDFPGPLVVTQPVSLKNVPMSVTGFGTVQAKVRLQIIPQVSGRVVQIHPQLLKGGFFKKDEPLIVIDPRNFELAVRQAQADVARMEVKLEQEQAEAAVACHEWEQLNPGQEPDSPLVFRVPHIHQAQAELAGAQAQLEKAQLDLERTIIRLPFDGRVIEKSVEAGQYVSFGKTIAEVYGTEVMEIPVPLEDHQLAWFDIPNENGNNGRAGAKALVTTRFAGSDLQWSGQVVRTEGLVDQTSRMVHVIIEINNAIDLFNKKQSLLPGMFVEVQILGRTLTNVLPLPNHAIRNGHQVWTVVEDKLRICDVEIVRQTREVTYVSGGLEPGTEVITSSLNYITEGMKVRVSEKALSEEREAQ
jgi:RND family efflux transporter MFP subunit